ncbi:MAG: hypothetical protein HC906_12680 [Bacteroidales bacterium]|nr:hypothetical protein [Bacteroidales bacterium]
MKFFLQLTLMLLLSNLVYSQDCTDYHQYQCTYADYSFFYSRQSKSFLTSKGQTTEIRIIAYEGEDYYVAVCGNKKFGKLQLRIIEDDADKTVLYDNATNDYLESITFTNEATRNLILEVTVPSDQGTSKESKDLKCVGVVVQFRKTK